MGKKSAAGLWFGHPGYRITHYERLKWLVLSSALSTLPDPKQNETYFYD